MKYKMIHVQNDPYTVTTVVPHYDRSVFLLKECDTNHTTYFTVSCRTQSFRVRNTSYVYTFSLHHTCQKKNYSVASKGVVYNGEMALILVGVSGGRSHTCALRSKQNGEQTEFKIVTTPVSIVTLSSHFYSFFAVRSKSFCTWKKAINGRLQEWRYPRRCAKAE